MAISFSSHSARDVARGAGRPGAQADQPARPIAISACCFGDSMIGLPLRLLARGSTTKECVDRVGADAIADHRRGEDQAAERASGFRPWGDARDLDVAFVAMKSS